ncbi:MAG: DUF1330 domain-containing protein [bacterium]|nr:DUF1330 domain-containing protein [bacterium]
MAKAYVVVLLDVKDQDLYVEYAKRATEIEDRHGGRAIVAAEVSEIAEGAWPSERLVVLEFPTMDHARAWYEDPEYQTLIPMRRAATDSTLAFVPGYVAG